MPPLLRLALPLIAGELGWNAMSVVDTVMVGRLPHSAVAMAAAGIAQVLFNVCVWGAGGILLGLDTLISQAFGAREHDEANRWLMHGMLLAVLLSAALLALFLGGPVFLRALPIDPAVRAVAIPAMNGLDWGILPLLVYFTLRRYLQAAHQTRPIMYALVSANLVNIAGDWLLIFGHRWGALGIPAFGVEGSSWATSFSRVYLMLFVAAAVWLADREHGYGLTKTSLRIEAGLLRRIFRLGAPAGLAIVAEIGIFALVTTIIATLGAMPLAGSEIALQTAATTFMVPYAISTATSVRVGHGIGRLRTALTPAELATATLAPAGAGWAGILAGAGVMLVSAVVFLCVPGAIARLFTPDRAVIAAAVPLLLVAAGFQFFDGIQVTAAGALRGAGNTTAPMLAQIGSYWLVGMPLGLWLGLRHGWGATGLWVGLWVALMVASVALVAVWAKASRRLGATLRLG